MYATGAPQSFRTIIRPAALDDCGEVRRIARAAFEVYIPRMNREPAPMHEDYEARVGEGSLHILEEAEQGVVGFVIMLPEQGAMLLDTIAIDPKTQGNGYGRKLIEFVEAAAHTAGVPEMRTYTNEVMVENLALYAHLGFVETRRAEENGYRRVFMTKKLFE